ncbi:MAG: MarR family transcriptional regulator [Actinomycetota bacterium]|nr:MarR family transcriptional regulator [Actinomycetota bacterium]
MATSDGERAWAALLRAHARFVPRLDQGLQAATGLPLAWYDVLLELSSAGGRLRMSELGERVVLSRTRVSRIVDDLVRAGLVAREANPEDGRSFYALLTEEGVRRFRAGARVYREGIERQFAGRVDAASLRSVAETLEQLLASDDGD